MDRDDEDDYRESKDAVKPVAVTLFDMVKSKLGVEEPETEKETPQQNYDRDEENSSYRSRGGRGGGGRGRGGRGRGQNNRTSNYSNRNQNSNESSKQVYDRDDFSYDLGDATKVII